MLLRTADRLRASAPLRHLFFLGAALLAIVLVGYHVGTFDQTVHLPFLQKYAQPGLYLDDPFLDMRRQHYSFFWFLFLPFARQGLEALAPVLFAGHLLATYLTFWAVWDLARLLFDDPLAELLAVATFFVPHVGLSLFPMFEFSLLNRTAALPAALFILGRYLRGRRLGAFLLLGLLANLHVLTAGYTLGLLLFDCGLNLLAKREWRPALFGVLLFILGALPVLAWRALSPPSGLAPQPDWFRIVSLGLFAHLFYLFRPQPYVLLPLFSGLGTLGLYLAARPERAARAHETVWARFILAGLAGVALQAVLTYVWPVTFLAQAQIMRTGFLAMIFCQLYFAGYLAARYASGRLRGADFAWQAGSFIGGVIGLAPLMVWGIQRWLPASRWRGWLTAVVVAGMSAASLGVALHYQVWFPGIYLEMRPTAWHRAQVWARDNTPLDAMFITPLDQWWFFDADWRVFSQRGQVASLSDLLEVALVPGHLQVWEPRFEALAPGVIKRFDGDALQNRRMAAEAFNGLSDAALLRAARDFRADYLVVQKPHLRPFPAAYENEGYVIYDLAPLLRP